MVSVNNQLNSADITITDSGGRIVYEMKDSNLSGQVSINVSDLSPGIYQITLLSSDNLSLVKRLVVQ